MKMAGVTTNKIAYTASMNTQTVTPIFRIFSIIKRLIERPRGRLPFS